MENVVFYVSKCKSYPVESIMAQRMNMIININFLCLGTWRKWVVNALFCPLYPLDWPGTHGIGGWVGPRTWLDWCWKFPLSTGFRSPNCPTRSESLYLLRCPSHYFLLETEFVNIIKFVFRPDLVPILASLTNCVP